MIQIAELRAAMATAGSALMALGIGLVILAHPSGAKENRILNAGGWALVVVGVALLFVSIVWTILIARKKPDVVIECGAGNEFFRETLVQGGRGGAVNQSRLRVRETKDVSAANVHIQVVSVVPLDASAAISAGDVRPGLQWVDGSDYYDLPGKGRGFVRICEREPEYLGGAVTTSIPSLQPGALISLELDVMVGQQRTNRFKFLVDWSDERRPYPEVSSA